jgi:uncharacterized protein YbjT (DUF2867 family)
MTEKKRVLVTGASGNIGRLVAASLGTKDVQVRAYARGVKAMDVAAGIEVIRGDLLDEAALTKAAQGADAAFLLWPFLSTDGAEAAVRAVSAHVERVVYLSTAGAGVPLDGALNPISAIHYTVEELIVNYAREWTLVRPLGFASNTLLWAAQTRAGDEVKWPFAESRRSLVHDSDIADVIVRALVSDELVGTKPVLTGPATHSQREQVEFIGRSIGRQIAFAEVPPAAAREQMLSWGMPAAFVDGVLGYWARCVHVPEPVNGEVERITGRPARTLQEWIEQNRSAFA